jgi:predicted DNA-binding WGR domain protein
MTKLVVFLSPVLLDPNFSPSLAAYEYEKDGVDIAFCGLQQAQIEASVSAKFRLMATYPQISYFIMSTKEGRHAYLLSREKGEFPSLRKLKARGSPSSEASEYWEEFEVQSFLKPNAGMIETLIEITKATHVLVVWIGGIDWQTANGISLRRNCQIDTKSFLKWMAEVPRAQQQTAQTTPIAAGSTSRYFEYVDPAQNAYKFWRITLRPDGLGFETKYGRLGTNGQSKLKIFTTPFACRQAYDDIIRQKLRKGYVES